MPPGPFHLEGVRRGADAGLVHRGDPLPRLKHRLATHFVPFAEFEQDAAAGTLPDFSLIEPNMLAGTYDHVPPGPVPPPDPAAPPGEFGFAFDRSGYRVPAVIVSPWVEPGSVYNEEYRHTSLIATLRKVWGLGEAFTGRDASARTFDHVFSATAPRDPGTWAAITTRAVPDWTMDPEVVGKGLSSLGKGLVPAFIAMARQLGVPLPAELNDPDAALPPGRVVGVLRDIAGHFFPLLAADANRRNV